MSILLKLFGFTKLPPWLIELAVIGALALGIWLYHLHVVRVATAAGVAQQQAADKKATEKLVAETAQQTAERLAAAEKAADARAKEVNALHQYIADHPVHGSLCVQPAATHPRSPVVPERGPAQHLDAGPGAPTGDIQSVLERDSSVGPPGAADQRGMLSLLAQRADESAAELREYQARHDGVR